MQSWHIHIEGQVQGVGFRPFVYQLAQQYQLSGWVNNTVDGVHIAFNASTAKAEAFCAAIVARPPRLARISRYQLRPMATQVFAGFEIVHSQTTGEARLLLSPDFALCPSCRAELHDPQSRRFNYPFITCTQCGPRYSIVQQLPYDRATTAMAAFSPCPACQREYDAPEDRRYYSQTNSCPQCPITLSLWNAGGQLLSQNTDAIIAALVQYWEAGQIVAIKGIGGYLLTCDARNAEAIQRLRTLKFRPTKPFALMYPQVEAVRQQLALPLASEEALLSPAAPIVLVAKTSTTDTWIAGEAIAPGLAKIGLMLPYTPLFDCLLQAFGRPIVATSANISQAPIIFTEAQAQLTLPQIADYYLSNNREIAVPQDDSVVQYTPFFAQRIILRRSRGMAPTHLQSGIAWPAQTILATGALLKSTFTLLQGGNTYVSQYLGDLQHFDTEQNYQHTLQHFLTLFAARPSLVLTDAHPEYASTQFGHQLAADLQIPVERVQHHQAHFGAILGEHELIHHPEAILGVIWDGTGLGDDGQVWGGEFIKYENYSFLRCYHFDYFDFILGDKMPKEPRISALAACWDIPGAGALLRAKFSESAWEVYHRLLEQGNHLQTSSVGRIFDAVAALLNLGDYQRYEGEAALRLETLAEQYCQENGLDFSESYFRDGAHYYRVPTKTLFSGIIRDLQGGKSAAFIAAKFHYSLVHLVKIIAGNLHLRVLAFSGGVFQNSLLVDLLHHHLGGDFRLCFHENLSPNDENISFGQLVCYQIRQQQADPFIHHKSQTDVFSNSR